MMHAILMGCPASLQCKVMPLEVPASLPDSTRKSLPMSMPALFKGRLSLPVIGAPLFIISVPDLVTAQCKAGIVGAFPALNARPQALLDEWLARIPEELAACCK